MAHLAFCTASPISLVNSQFSSSVSALRPQYSTPLSKRPCVSPCHLRMQSEAPDDDSIDQVDETPSDTYVPASEANEVSQTQQESKRSSLISRLLQLCAVTARGQLSTQGQTNNIEDVVTQLEELNPNPQPIDTDMIDGYWTLVYTSSSSSSDTNSPIKSISKILLQPVLQLGQIRQKIAVSDGSIITEADIIAFPATSATIKTNARITPVGGERLEVVVEKSTVTGGKLAGQLDLGGISFDIPVEQILSRLRNMSPETYFDTYYLDEQLRISRAKNGNLFIYTRLD